MDSEREQTDHGCLIYLYTYMYNTKHYCIKIFNTIKINCYLISKHLTGTYGNIVQI